ncbi:MAG: hypothetical protein GY821_02010 [Gammaproteobacteria bacterium]|nr:hypothetical protein [Gammaproteobacteria bacterium]
MSMGIRLVAEYYDLKSGEVLESKILGSKEINKPTTPEEFGFLHAEQIEILQGIQDFKLHYEAQLINQENACPKCNSCPSRRGTRTSNFHAALTDHQISIQRRICRCGWKSPDTVDGIYGSALHPDLVEKQVVQGVVTSFRQASTTLNAESKSVRSINNDDRIRRNVSEVAKIIETEKLKPRSGMSSEQAAKQLIVVVDGGHIKSKDEEKRSIEAMIATVYHPQHIKKIDNHHNNFFQKTSVASALSDKQKTIKQLTLNACRKEGANARVTELTCLTDGASNCWSITNSLKRCCKKLTNVLDWFHITKRFTVIHNRVDEEFWEELEKVKWFLWHGKPDEGLKRLLEIQSEVTEEKLLEDLQDLYEYLERNKKYMVNYDKREAEHLPFTSTYAESSVNTVINARQKDNKKMQWSREGANSILQIRTSRFSNTWEQDWKQVKNEIYVQAA